MTDFAEDAAESLTYSKRKVVEAMSDLINGRTPEEIKRNLSYLVRCENCPQNHEYGCDYDKQTEECRTVNDTLALIERLEAQQLNQIVRCKDCAHWKPCEVKGFEGKMYCEWAGWLVGENAYCVYGEAKDDAD